MEYQSALPRSDLQDILYEDADIKMFVDGSCKKNLDSTNATSYAVVTIIGTFKSECLPPHYSAQAAELFALTEVCKLAKGNLETIEILFLYY